MWFVEKTFECFENADPESVFCPQISHMLFVKVAQL